jgi:hypothetical protein
MDIVIASILALGLLIGLIFILHRHQLSESHLNADKNIPLPPLSSFGQADYSNKDDASQPDSETEKTLPPTIVRPQDNSSITLSKYRVDEPAETEARQSEHWLEKISQLKKANKLDEALTICESEFPLWSAYQQAALIHRAKVKNALKTGEPVDPALQGLYQLATTAEFLHGRIKGLPDLTLSQLKHLKLERLNELDMPYLTIGYLELRLIKKTDIKLLNDLWGKPDSHQSPREVHREYWLELAATQSTLF